LLLEPMAETRPKVKLGSHRFWIDFLQGLNGLLAYRFPWVLEQFHEIRDRFSGSRTDATQGDNTKAKMSKTSIIRHPSASHALAASISWASKYLIFAIVNGLHTVAIHFSQVFSPRRAIFLILVQ